MVSAGPSKGFMLAMRSSIRAPTKADDATLAVHKLEEKYKVSKWNTALLCFSYVATTQHLAMKCLSKSLILNATQMADYLFWGVNLILLLATWLVSAALGRGRREFLASIDIILNVLLTS
ncbi:hypothetical protein PMG11_06359 [Penicillium brasilianum]|uniref:Uncharacterized protein n=1 Tax=Penicillium brasilianum TaxID=104259 RepID=A0A0F7TLZ4_PENBI|nr:hypothetical protein PMG11_06359 [Penicillium brasilianum]